MLAPARFPRRTSPESWLDFAEARERRRGRDWEQDADSGYCVTGSRHQRLLKCPAEGRAAAGVTGRNEGDK
jgi:hypothetical protein